MPKNAEGGLVITHIGPHQQPPDARRDGERRAAVRLREPRKGGLAAAALGQIRQVQQRRERAHAVLPIKRERRVVMARTVPARAVAKQLRLLKVRRRDAHRGLHPPQHRGHRGAASPAAVQAAKRRLAAARAYGQSRGRTGAIDARTAPMAHAVVAHAVGGCVPDVEGKHLISRKIN